MNPWRSLRMRLVSSYMALALLLLAVAGMVFSAALSAYAQVEQRQRLTRSLEQAKVILSEARAAGESPDVTLQRLQRYLPDMQVEALPGPTINPLLPPSPPAGTVLKLFRFGDDTLALPVIIPAPEPAKPVYQITLRPQSSSLLSSIYRQTLTTLALALLLAGWIGWWFSRWLSRPLARLADATTAVAAGDFVQTVPPTGVAELDRLADQFNRMVLRLRDSFRSLAAERDVARRFAADAAHELKTPVTTLRAYHEVVDEHPERLSQLSPPISRQIERMERIITALLHISHLTDGSDITLAPAPLAAALSPLEPVFADLARDYGHTFAMTGANEPLPVCLDPQLLELAVANLVDNACKYTPPGGQVRLILERAGTDAHVTVADTGPGIPPEELPYLFDRFHRGINTQAIPGTGLGLSIVQEAAARMGGTVAIESAPGQGSRFTLRLPLAEAKT